MGLLEVTGEVERLRKKHKTYKNARNQSIEAVTSALTSALEQLQAINPEQDGGEGESSEEKMKAIFEQLGAEGLGAKGSGVESAGKEVTNGTNKAIKLLDKACPKDLHKALPFTKNQPPALNPTSSFGGLNDSAMGSFLSMSAMSPNSSFVSTTSVADSCACDYQEPGAIWTEAIIEHFLRQGSVNLAQTLASEANISLNPDKAKPYAQLAAITEALKQDHNLGPAEAWVEEHKELLKQRNSSLPFKLKARGFLQRLEKGEIMAALDFARENFAEHSGTHLPEIKKLMGALVFGKRLHSSPYQRLLESQRWDELAADFRKQALQALGLGFDQPLRVCVHAGAKALPALMKFATVMGSKLSDSQNSWSSAQTLPIEVDLGPECQYHSIFVCPVSREQASRENAPIMMQCGHVLCEQSLRKLSRGGARFKCPYCPAEVSQSGCLKLTL